MPKVIGQAVKGEGAFFLLRKKTNLDMRGKKLFLNGVAAPDQVRLYCEVERPILIFLKA